MLCPTCGAPTQHTLNSRLVEPQRVYRRRACANGHRWSTAEVPTPLPTDERDWSDRLWDATERVRELLKEAELVLAKSDQLAVGVTKYPQLHDYEWLLDHYVKQGMTGARIAELLGCTTGAVFNALVEFQIPRRSRGTPPGCRRRPRAR